MDTSEELEQELESSTILPVPTLWAPAREIMLCYVMSLTTRSGRQQ